MYICVQIQIYTPLKFNISPLKRGRAPKGMSFSIIFQGQNVNLQGCIRIYIYIYRGLEIKPGELCGLIYSYFYEGKPFLTFTISQDMYTYIYIYIHMSHMNTIYIYIGVV